MRGDDEPDEGDGGEVIGDGGVATSTTSPLLPRHFPALPFQPLGIQLDLMRGLTQL
jgi:hypothetical protein